MATYVVTKTKHNEAQERSARKKRPSTLSNIG